MKNQNNLETNLGNLEATYISYPLKPIQLALFLLAWLVLSLIGLPWGTNQICQIISVIGGILLVRALYCALASYQQVRLYKNGICVIHIWGTELWRYKEIDSVHILGGGFNWVNEFLLKSTLVGCFCAHVKQLITRLDFLSSASYQKKPIIEHYQIFAQGKQILKIGPEFQLWEELGKAIFDQVNSWSISHS